MLALLPNPVSKVYGVFVNSDLNSDLPSSSERKQKATEKVCIVLGISWTSLNNWKGGFPFLALGLFICLFVE